MKHRQLAVNLLAVSLFTTSIFATSDPASRAVQAWKSSRLHFEAEPGRNGERTQFIARGAGFNLLLSQGAATLHLSGGNTSKAGLVHARLMGGNVHSQAEALEPLPGR